MRRARTGAAAATAECPAATTTAAGAEGQRELDFSGAAATMWPEEGVREQHLHPSSRPGPDPAGLENSFYTGEQQVVHCHHLLKQADQSETAA